MISSSYRLWLTFGIWVFFYLGMVTRMNGNEYQEVKLRPCVSEFSGYYNIPESQVVDDIECLRTTTELATLLKSEVNSVIDAVRDRAVACGLRFPRKSEGAQSDSDFLIVPTGDRTLAIEWRTEAVVSLDLIKSFQDFLRKYYENWRIVLFGLNRDASFVVYHDVVAFERCIAGANLQERLSTAMKLEKKHVAATTGEHERQYMRVLQILKRMTSRDLASKPLSILAHFANSKGNRERHAVWVLTIGSERAAEWKVEKGEVAYGTKSEITKDGRVLKLYSRDPGTIGHLYEVIGPSIHFKGPKLEFVSGDATVNVELPPSFDD